MSCETKFPEELVAWLDGELDAADRRRVEAHLEGCADCREEAELLRRAGELVARLPGREPAPGFAARVAAAADEPRRRGLLSLPRLLATAAAAAVLVAAAWWVARPPGGSDVLTAREERAIAEDLLLLSNLELLRTSDPEELARLVDDLDVLEAPTPDSVVQGG